MRPAGRRRATATSRSSAVLCDPDGAPVEVSEALLSTEYGPDGVQRRATLELWIDGEDGAAAARRRHADQLQPGAAGPGLDSEVAFFRWSLEGREGLGHYEVVRARWLRAPGSRP